MVGSSRISRGTLVLIYTWILELGSAQTPAYSETVDENGVRTIVEYSVNDDGKKVKVRRL
jgi:translation initiation factor 3 subunit G